MHRECPALFDGRGHSFGIKATYKRTGSVSWRCTCRAPPNPCKATVLQKGDVFIFGKHKHTCKKKKDKSLEAEIVSKGKAEIRQNIFATARQVVEPIFTAAFNIDPERNLPVLKHVQRTINRVKEKNYQKNPLNLHFDWGNSINLFDSYNSYIFLFCSSISTEFARRIYEKRHRSHHKIEACATFHFRY
jgi:hypothetical protein